ncbi:MAG: flippase-like domain-containing protein [Prevotellaceae bacterium]|jgi:uncharacterized protein (TIRG00374 family)|nr:flippase-like domain-containing protein [Prevotellaceae bacterium]
MATGKKIIATAGKYILFLSITAALLYFCFRDMSFRELLDGLKDADYWWIAASMLAGFSAFIVRARRWQLIIQPLGYRPSLRNTYDAVMLTYLANFALPRMGEIVRCGALRKTEKIPFESSLGTVVMERVFDMVCLLLITISVVFFRFDTFGKFFSDNLWQPFAARITDGNYTILYIIAGVIALPVIAVIAFREKIRQHAIAVKLKKLWTGLYDGLRAGFRLQQRGKFLSCTVLLWLAYWLQAFTVIKAMPETQFLTGVDALFLMIVGGLGWVAPVQGGMGAYHFFVSLTLFAIYGIPQNHGVVFATISHETQAIMMIVFGFISWASVIAGSRRR